MKITIELPNDLTMKEIVSDLKHTLTTYISNPNASLPFTQRFTEQEVTITLEQ